MPDGQFFKDVLVCVEIVTDGQGTTLEDRIGDDDERERMEMNFNKFVATMRGMRTNGTSQRWKPEFVSMMRHAHSAYVMPIDHATKECIRTRKFRCAICGQLEKHADSVIHLAGSPIEDVIDCESFDAREWETSRLDKLSSNFDSFYEGYLEVQDMEETDRDEDFPAPQYLGVVVPGEECMKHITRLFTAQTLLLDMCYDTYNLDTGTEQQELGFSATPERIQMLQTRWEEIVGLDAVPVWSSDVFWDRLLTRFGQFSNVPLLCRSHGHEDVDDAFDSIDFLQVAYDRLEMSLSASKLGGCTSKRTSKRKRSVVVMDDDDDEDELESDDDDGDEENDDVPLQKRHNLRPRTAKQGATAGAAAAAPAADDEPDDGRSSPRWAQRPRTTPSAKSTAQSLRAPVLESRVKVLKKLADLGYVLVDRPNFQPESIHVFIACATLQHLVLGKSTVRPEVAHDVLKNLSKLQSKLLKIDLENEGYAEAAIVSAASLTIMDLIK